MTFKTREINTVYLYTIFKIRLKSRNFTYVKALKAKEREGNGHENKHTIFVSSEIPYLYHTESPPKRRLSNRNGIIKIELSV